MALKKKMLRYGMRIVLQKSDFDSTISKNDYF